MRVAEIMSTAVQQVGPDVAAEEANSLMGLKRIRHLVVMDGSTLKGIVSERDLGGRSGAATRKDRRVVDLMTEHVVAVAPDTPVRKAANLMRGRTIGCLVVIERNRVVGIVTTADLLELLGRGADRPSPTRKRADLHYRAPHRAKKSPRGVW
jgi:acetoin utilization protein AcuB